MEKQGNALVDNAAYSITWSVLVCGITWLAIFTLSGCTWWKLTKQSAERRQMTSQAHNHIPKSEETHGMMVLLSIVNFMMWSIPEVSVSVIATLIHFSFIDLRDIDVLNIAIYFGIEIKCLVQLVIYFILDEDLRKQITVYARAIKGLFMRQQ